MNQSLSERLRRLPPEKLLRFAEALAQQLDESNEALCEPVAVIGLGCRFPNAEGPQAYWRLLRDGVCATEEIPSDRWRAEEWYDPDPNVAGKSISKFGGFIKGIDQFDASHFRISPRESESLDPQQRLFLEVAHDALEIAGQSREMLDGSLTGVFLGIGLSTYSGGIAGRKATEIDAHCGTGNTASTASGRLSHFYNLRGPCLSVDTACSSSLLAVHLAMQSIRRRECDVAIAGGVSLILAPESHVYFSRLGALSSGPMCKTFDQSADGYVRGEGCGVVILKPLSAAIADGDHVWAVIRGSATNHDGYTSGLTAPSVSAQQQVIERALSDAQIHPDEIDLIECHGTGTPLGDPTELMALNRVFATATRCRKLLLGAVKPNIGHLESAAGIAGVIKAVLMLANNKCTPHIGCTHPTNRFPWQSSTLQICDGAESIAQSTSSVERVGVSSFGFGGTNVHAILANAPSDLKQRGGGVGDDVESIIRLPFLISAPDHELLQKHCQSWVKWLQEHEQASLVDVCYSALARRTRHSSRATSFVRDSQELIAFLNSVADGKSELKVETTRNGLLWINDGFTDTTQVDASTAGCRDRQHLKDAWRNLEPWCQFRGFVGRLAQAENLLAWGSGWEAASGCGLGFFVACCAAGAIRPVDVALDGNRIRVAQVVSSNLAVLHPETFSVIQPTELVNELERQIEGVQSGAVAAYDQNISLDPSDRKIILSGDLGIETVLSICLDLENMDRRVSWREVFKELFPKRPYVNLPLPPVPLRRKRYWIDRHPESNSNGIDARPHSNRFTLTWHARTAGLPLSDRGDGLVRFLNSAVFTDPDNTRKWKRGGAQIEMIDTDKLSDATQLNGVGKDKHRLFVALGLDERNEKQLGAADQIESFSAQLREIVNAATIARGPVQFVLLTSGSIVIPVFPRPAIQISIENGFWTGAISVLNREFPMHSFQLIDLDSTQSVAKMADLCELKLIAETFTSEPLIAIRGNRAFVARLTCGGNHFQCEQFSTAEPSVIRPGYAYWLAGGSGELGLRLARWLLNAGADRVVISGSRLQPGNTATRLIEESAGRVEYICCDLTDDQQTQAAASQIRDKSPLAGLFHLANRYRDVSISDLSFDQLAEMMQSKVVGAENLDLATDQDTLDFFLVFSSTASILGNPGQVAYAAANSWLNTWCLHRRQAGRPTSIVNWGPWQSGKNRFDSAIRWLVSNGVYPIDDDQAFNILNEVLQRGDDQTFVININPRELAEQLAGHVPIILECLTPKDTGVAEASQLKSSPESYLLDLAQKALGIPTEEIDVDAPLSSLGCDSMIAMELQSRLYHEYQTEIPISMLLGDYGISAIGQYISQQQTQTSVRVPTPESPIDVTELSSEEVDQMLRTLLANDEESRKHESE
ncbi:MAG: SDR family NAD(P)-dependent oxidoreductase [Planctomycetales bacterium]|nr:SDR family NAD(P)-dependent oxidoreductase [Planctomycetales bacterium]